jgi:hypothetical protein
MKVPGEKMPIKKSGGVLGRRPVVPEAQCFFCGRNPRPGEEYGSDPKDWNTTPATCPECFAKPENQPTLRQAQKETRKWEQEKQLKKWSGWSAVIIIVALIVVGVVAVALNDPDGFSESVGEGAVELCCMAIFVIPGAAYAGVKKAAGK